MIATAIAWITISFVLLSFGDIGIYIYNKWGKREEKYNTPETFILGMCFVLIPLSLSSIWLPSNGYILLLFLIISIIYWIVRRKRFVRIWNKSKQKLSLLSRTQIFCFIAAILSVFLLVLWSSLHFDGAFYHQQQILWNEEYAVVPGLGNLEDRFGFNSNYLLLSAVFSFRFLFNDSLYVLQSILFVYVMCWVLYEFVRSGYALNRVVLLLIFFFFFLLNQGELRDSSTDVIPNICTFYLIASLVLYPDSLNKKYLFLIILPVSLVTFKVSVAPLCLISLYVMITAIKWKKVAALVPVLTFTSAIVLLWLVRNLIISGYLVYPFYELDLFSFDWKVPQSVAMMQREIISEHAKLMFDEIFSQHVFYSTWFPQNIVYIINNLVLILFLFCVFVSPLFFFFKKKEKMKKEYLILYSIVYIFMVYWIISAPSHRFASGVIFGTMFLIITLLLGQRGEKKLSKNYNYLLICTCCIFFLIAIRTSVPNYMTLPYGTSQNDYQKKDVFFKPCVSKYKVKSTNVVPGFSTYNMNGLRIYISEDAKGRTFDKLPATSNEGFPVSPSVTTIQHISTVEARGTSLQEGFRTKSEYLQILDTMIKDYIRKKRDFGFYSPETLSLAY